MSEVVYLNGEFIPYNDAKVPVEDRGYQFGDGIYEVARTYNGKLFRMDAHMERLRNSAAELEMELPPVKQIEEAALELMRRNGHPESAVYIQVSRGAAPRAHLIPSGLKPNVMMTARPVSTTDPEILRNGAAAVTAVDDRWHRCNIKTVCLLPNTLAKVKAHRAGALEAIFVRDGIVTEGTSSNLLAVFGGTIYTHPADNLILHGITRNTLLQLAETANIPVKEQAFTVMDLLKADEIILCGTILEATPVISVDARTIGNGQPGPVAAKLYAGLMKWGQEGARPRSW